MNLRIRQGVWTSFVYEANIIDFETVVGQCYTGLPQSWCAHGSRIGPLLKTIFFTLKNTKRATL